MKGGTYLSLLKSFGFQSFLWTQFLGAFNDNVSKWIVTLYAIDIAIGHGTVFAAIVGGIFVLPFVLFSSYSGYLADIYSKRTIIVIVKLFEIASMLVGYFAITSGNIYFMLIIPFLMGLHSTFFSPAKYGILPEMLDEKDLSRANGILEMTTFMAIILGTSIGGVLYQYWKDEPGYLNLVLIGVAVFGAITSFFVPKVPPSGAQHKFSLNPLYEIKKGITDLRKYPALWQTALGITYFWLLGAFLLTVIAPLGKEVMGLSDEQTSQLETFLAIGIGVGSLVAGKLSGDKVELGLVPLGSIGMGIGVLTLSFYHNSFVQALISLTWLGFFAGFYAVPLNALLQQKSEKSEKGRILATNNFMNSLGMILAFSILALFGGAFHLAANQSIFLMGITTFGVTIYLLAILPDFLIRFCLWLFTHTVYYIKSYGQTSVPFKGPTLLVCNKTSLIDSLWVGACLQRFVRFMVNPEYYDKKPYHWLFKLMKAIPIQNETDEALLACVDKARKELKEGHVVCIFVEKNDNFFIKIFDEIKKDLSLPVIPVRIVIKATKSNNFLYYLKYFFTPIKVYFGSRYPQDVSPEVILDDIYKQSI